MKRSLTLVWTSTLLVALAACSGDDDPDEPGEPGGGTVGPTASPSGPDPSRPRIGTWTSLADAPSARTEVGTVALDGQVYLAGGYVQGGSGGPVTFARYDPEQSSWEDLAPVPEPRHHAPLAAYDGHVYLVGGCDHTGSAFGACPSTDTLFVYDVEADTWEPGPPLPEPAGAHAVATTDDGRIHVIGGISGGQGSALDVSRLHQVYDTATGTWDMLPEPELTREHHGAAYLDGKIYVVGGRNGAEGYELEVYDIASEEWSRLADAPTGRGGVAVVAFQGQIYFLGGEGAAGTTGGTFDQAERYDPETDNWEEVTPIPVARHGLGGAAVDDGIILVCGGPQQGLSFSAHTDIWQP